MSLFRESSAASATATDTSSNVASSSSTPPTTVADSASQSSEASKHDVIVVQPQDSQSPEPADAPSPVRSRRSRLSAPVYNLVQLSGTAGHGKRRSKGDIVSDRTRRRRTISGDTLVEGLLSSARSPGTRSFAKSRDTLDAFDFGRSPTSVQSPRTRRQVRDSPRALRVSGRSSGIVKRATGVSSFGARISKIGKRSGKAVGKGVSKISRELMRLQDTKEYSGIEDKPVIHTVWAKGKFVDPKAPPPAPAPKKAKVEEGEAAKEESAEPVTNTKKRTAKKFLAKGLYSGQEVPTDLTKGLTNAEKKKLAQHPELLQKRPVNKTMPPPIFTGFRMLIAGRDFKLPYLTCNPLPPGQPKPDEWKKMTKSKFAPASRRLHSNYMLNVLTSRQIDLLAIPKTTGASRLTLLTCPSVFVNQKTDVMTTAKTESCFMSVTRTIAILARPTAPTAHSVI